MTSLIGDPRFTAGVRDVGYDCTATPPYIYQGDFVPGGSSPLFASPQWDYTQNHSFYPLANSPKFLSAGEFAGMTQWASPGKTLRFRRDDSAAWDWSIRSRSIAEYRWWDNHHYCHFIPNPQTGKFGCAKDWPGFVHEPSGLWRLADYHKWVHQYLTYTGAGAGGKETLSVPISQMSAITFRLIAKKTTGAIVVRNTAYGYTNWHAVRFFVMLHVVSAGKQVAVQIPIYDSRKRREPGWGPMLDGPTGVQMVMVPQSAVTADTLWLDAPVTFAANLLPQVKRAVSISYPKASLSDFRIKSNIVLGVEDSGICDVEIAFKDFALTV